MLRSLATDDCPPSSFTRFQLFPTMNISRIFDLKFLTTSVFWSMELKCLLKYATRAALLKTLRTVAFNRLKLHHSHEVIEQNGLHLVFGSFFSEIVHVFCPKTLEMVRLPEWNFLWHFYWTQTLPNPHVFHPAFEFLFDTIITPTHWLKSCQSQTSNNFQKKKKKKNFIPLFDCQKTLLSFGREFCNGTLQC